MSLDPRRQVPRTTATRAALIRSARRQFGESGYAGVGTEAIVRAAGVTRGALYHHFEDKTELFATVYQAVEDDIVIGLAERIAADREADPMAMMRLGAHAWLDACADREVQQIVLIDGPAVLGWERWRDIGQRNGLGLVQGVVRRAIDAGQLPAQPAAPLAHVLVGALDEAGMYVARAYDQLAATEEMRIVFDRLIAGLTIS